MTSKTAPPASAHHLHHGPYYLGFGGTTCARNPAGAGNGDFRGDPVFVVTGERIIPIRSFPLSAPCKSVVGAGPISADIFIQRLPYRC